MLTELATNIAYCIASSVLHVQKLGSCSFTTIDLAASRYCIAEGLGVEPQMSLGHTRLSSGHSVVGWSSRQDIYFEN